MALVEFDLYGTRINKVDLAVRRIREFEPISNGFMDEPYFVAYSGGKDSDVLRILFELAGVKHDLVHNHTTVDAPETVRYIRTIPNIQILKPHISMWDLIVKKRMPPTRTRRYCCDVLKEGTAQGRFLVTGVRWDESNGRKNNRSSLEVLSKDRKKSLKLNVDNDESRKMLETCSVKGKRVLNPIVDWKNEDVWEFLRLHRCESNPLYKMGFNRVGCVGCPMAGKKGMIFGFERYPKIKDLYMMAFRKMLDARQNDGLEEAGWKSEQDVFEWWVYGRDFGVRKEYEQIHMLE